MTENSFIEELKLIGINIDTEQLKKLNKYYELLIEWNKKINLTAITEKDQVYLKHFYDSLTLNKIIDLKKENSICDIGTGAGFPGIVLKIVFPNLKVTLVDSLKKRIDFLNLIIKELELENIIAIHTRSEEFALTNREKFDFVTARAVAPLNILLEYSIPMVKKNKYFIAMKGNIEKEEKTFDNSMKILNTIIEKTEEFTLPNELSKRTLIKFKKLEITSKKYPRKFNEIKKKPL